MGGWHCIVLGGRVAAVRWGDHGGEGGRLAAVHYVLARAATMLEEVAAGRVPEAWTPLETTTCDAVVFLRPLDAV